jgi:hypothetical protein
LVVAGLLLVVVPVLAVYGARLRTAAAEYELVVDAWIEGVEEAFERVPLLSAEEEAMLRRALNRRHVALAQDLGIPPVASRDSLALVAQERGLVSVGSPSPYYVAGEARYSIARLTPDAAASLDSLGARFHALLDAAGLPRFRLVVTSVLRSTEDQAALQGRNVNAARGRSSHEYGTTYDVHYRRFAYGDAGRLAPPLPPDNLPGFLRRGLHLRARTAADDAFAALAADYPSRLQALLGRALIGLEDEGVLVTLMERRQTVFHTTVARRLADTGAAKAR